MLSNNQMVEQRADMMQSNVYQNYQYPHNQTQVMSTKKTSEFQSDEMARYHSDCVRYIHGYTWFFFILIW